MIERIKEINNLLLRKSFKVTFENVKQHLLYLGISRFSDRTFLRDIQNLKEIIKERYPTLEDKYGELLIYSRLDKSYRYVKEGISAFPSLSENELNQLASVIQINKHLFTDGNGEALVSKLTAISLESNISKYNELLPWGAIQLINEGNRSGSNYFKLLLECIYSKSVIEITHKGLLGSSKAKNTNALPFLIKEYNNGWYTGWYLLLQEIKVGENIIHPNINNLRLYALDRIENIKKTNIKVKLDIPFNFNPASYFDNCLGITRNNILNSNLKAEKVYLKTRSNSWLADFLLKYPIHRSQKKVSFNENTKELELELFLEINNELESFLIKYSEQLIVLSPVKLKDHIYSMLKKAVSLYNQY